MTYYYKHRCCSQHVFFESDIFYAGGPFAFSLQSYISRECNPCNIIILCFWRVNHFAFRQYKTAATHITLLGPPALRTASLCVDTPPPPWSLFAWVIDRGLVFFPVSKSLRFSLRTIHDTIRERDVLSTIREIACSRQVFLHVKKKIDCVYINTYKQNACAL